MMIRRHVRLDLAEVITNASNIRIDLLRRSCITGRNFRISNIAVR